MTQKEGKEWKKLERNLKGKEEDLLLVKIKIMNADRHYLKLQYFHTRLFVHLEEKSLQQNAQRLSTL